MTLVARTRSILSNSACAIKTGALPESLRLAKLEHSMSLLRVYAKVGVSKSFNSLSEPSCVRTLIVPNLHSLLRLEG